MSHEVKVGFFILVVYLVWIAGCFLAGLSITKDIPDQENRNPASAHLDHGDLLQQAELDRLHRVDKHFDARMDSLERQRVWLWVLIILGLLADLTQIWEGLFK